MWTAPPLTSCLFVLAAFFIAAFFVLFLLATLLAIEIAFVTGLLTFAGIASGRVRTALAALFAGTDAAATLLNSLIALSIVCHISSSPFDA